MIIPSMKKPESRIGFCIKFAASVYFSDSTMPKSCLLNSGFVRLLSRWLIEQVTGFVVTVALGGCQSLQGQSETGAGITKVTFWHGVNPPSNRDVLQVLVDRFNQEHPAIQVESLVGQAEQQLPKILAAVVGNASPDLCGLMRRLRVNWWN